MRGGREDFNWRTDVRAQVPAVYLPAAPEGGVQELRLQGVEMQLSTTLFESLKKARGIWGTCVTPALGPPLTKSTGTAPSVSLNIAMLPEVAEKLPAA